MPFVHIFLLFSKNAYFSIDAGVLSTYGFKDFRVFRLFRTKGCTIGGHKNLRQTSQLYKVKNQKYTLGKFGFLETRL
jgi:hypothetical protein